MAAVRKLVISAVGGIVLILGIAMIVLPGPAFILIPLGLAILSLEFPWAQRSLDWLKQKLRNRRKRSGGTAE